LKNKIIIGIIIAIIIVIGVGMGFSNSSEVSVEPIISENIQPETTNSEGTQFTLELSDAVTASGP